MRFTAKKNQLAVGNSTQQMIALPQVQGKEVVIKIEHGGLEVFIPFNFDGITDVDLPILENFGMVKVIIF